MADDDEFSDEIDWSSVPLNSISASMAVPRAPTTANNNRGTMAASVTTAGGGGGSRQYHSSSSGNAIDATAAYRSGYPPQTSSGQNRSRMSTGSMGVYANPPSANNVDDSLRRQIQDLQNQLQNKDDQIFELEATAATSAAESTHRTKQAETNAQKRIHLVEEELRRMRMEAEKYKGSWIRQKKRVVELEQQGPQTTMKSNNTASGGGYNASNHGVGGGNHGLGAHQHHGGANTAGGRRVANNLTTWGVPADVKVELRKVTPSISNEEAFDNMDHHPIRPEGSNNVTSPTKDSGSKKRKKRQSSNMNAGVGDVKRYLHEQFVDTGGLNSIKGDDSVRQRLAKHLLNRDEMGCYSLPGSDYTRGLSSSMPVESDLSMTMEVEHDDGQLQQLHEGDNAKGPRHRLPGAKSNAMQQDLCIEKETRTFVKSILYQTAESSDSISVPAKGSLSISGLVHVLLMRFNSLFHLDGTISNGDGDHEMEQENGPNQNEAEGPPPLGKSKLAIVLSNRKSSGEGNNFSSESCVTYATVSWRAALYLLHVIHDILLLSGNGRDDLRWWFHQSRQSGSTGGGRRSSTSSPRTDKEMSQGAKDVDGASSHPRIEGLSSSHFGQRRDAYRKEVLWTNSCHANHSAQFNIWDPMTMAQPCNAFFELLVGLMQGNVFKQSQNPTTEKESSNLGFEQILVQLVQLKAIDLVLALMSDAPPYENAEDSRENRAPYLWKSWFDSLFPSYSVGQTATNKGSSETPSIGDFFSPWEKSGGDQNSLLGSGRKHLTRLLANESNGVIQQSKRDAEKQGRTGRRSSRANYTTSEVSRGKSNNSNLSDYDRKQQERLSILIKSRILQLLSHFVLCSSSVHKSLYHIVNREEKLSLAKRILAAVLDDMEEYIVPCLSSGPCDLHTHDVDTCLELCHSCIEFLLILSRSNEGIRLLRLQMRLESEQGEPSLWPQSAIGCVTSVLNNTLYFAMEIEEKEGIVIKSTRLAHALNAIVDQCILFFKAILQFVSEQRISSSKAATFLALISEHRSIFQSCCQRILSHQSPNSMADPPRLLHFNKDLKHNVQCLFEETVLDENEENEHGK
ncbi:hypothetical protein ACHAXR_007042 [Thalassiosira sp. AJA248-18]